MKGIKSFYNVPFLITLAVLGSLLLGQRAFETSLVNKEQGSEVVNTDFGSFLAAQHAIYVNDFESASNLIKEVKSDDKNVVLIKNLTEFFDGKMPENAQTFKNSKDVVERLIYDAFLIQQDDWKSVYKRHNKDTSVLVAPIRIFSGSYTKNPKDTAKFVDSLKVDENWRSFIKGQIAVLNKDIDTAAKEFAKVHPEFMNVNDYLYLMSFYKENEMFEDMDILRDDFLSKVGGMYMLIYTDIPDWSNYDGYKNNLVFSLIQTISHTQVMLYTDLSLMFLRFAEIISDGSNKDAINYYSGQYYFYNSGDFETSFNSINKTSPLYLFGQLKIAEKNKDLKAIKKIVRENPLFVPAVQIIGQNCIKNGDKSCALSVVNRALKSKNLPLLGRLYFLKQRAYVYIMFGDAERAQKDLSEVIEQSKISPDLMLLQARIWALQDKNLDVAYSYAMGLIKMNTSNVAAWDLLSVIVEKREGVENALEILERVGEISPAISSVHEHLGDFYKKQGDIERAKKAYLHAIDLSDDYSIIVPVVQKKIRNLK